MFIMKMVFDIWVVVERNVLDNYMNVMPFRVDTQKLILPKKKGGDRRYKLSEQEKEEIRENKDWLSQRKLADRFNVDRKVIRYTIDPEFYEKMLASAKERRKDWRYYDREKQTIAIRNTRRYRNEVLNPKQE